MTGIEQLSKQFEKELTSARSVVIGTHLNPDGDALGSALAVSHWLDSKGVQNEVLCHHKAPRTLEFLPGVENIRQVPKYDYHDLAVVVDLDPLDRLGTTGEYILKAPRMIVVDHHVPHNAPGDFRVVDVEAPATALILTRMFLELGADITPDIALCLLCGIVTDTGSFRFPNTTPESLSLSAILLERGGNINLINEEVFQKKPYEAVKLYGHMLDTMHLECDNQIVWSSLTLKDFEVAGAEDEDTEGFVNELLAIDTAQIAMLLRENKPLKVRVSLRSRGEYDVAAVARYFGGGGHKNAAGCNFDEPIEQAAQKIVERLKLCLASS